jgi:SagB-type dehydrogenase family enzyme
MAENLTLPPAQRQGGTSLVEALDRRRSCRAFREDPLAMDVIGQCLWAAQGRTSRGRRTAPSAGATYPLEVYAVTPQGVACYDPSHHRLRSHLTGDAREALARAALDQTFIVAAPLTIVLCAVFARVAARYGKQRGERYTHIEIGHAAQNVLLQAEALGLGSVPVGAFKDSQVSSVLELPSDHVPLYLIPIGHPGAGG